MVVRARNICKAYQLLTLVIMCLTRSCACAQHHTEVSYCILLAQERIKIQFQSMVSTKCILLSHQHKVEKL